MSPPDRDLLAVDDVPAAFARLVADEISGAAPSPGQSAPPFRLVLSGGSTAQACYERLAADPVVPWGHVECLVGDERCVPPQDVAANQRMIRESLVDQVSPRPVFRPMDCGDPSAYEALVRSAASLDLVHLGLGPDGHTASLFPGSAALDAPADQLVARNADPSGNNPYERLSLTLAGIARARLAVFTVAGASKRAALRAVLAGDDLPAARVVAGRVVWLCDRDALGDAWPSS